MKLLSRVVLLILLTYAFFFSQAVLAQQGEDIGAVAGRITGVVGTLANMMIAISYIAGIGFVIASMFKFKQHKDNPTQIPLGAPLALLIIGVVLVFLPLLFGPIGRTIFGQQAQPAGEIPTQIDTSGTPGK